MTILFSEIITVQTFDSHGYYPIKMRKCKDFDGPNNFSLLWNQLLILLDNILGLTFEVSGLDLGYGWLYLIGGLVHLIPGLALSVRRLHDVGKSGWFLLIILIPLIGGIWLLVLECTEGNKSENKWGPNPKV